MIRSRTILLAIAALAFAACRGSGANEDGRPEMPPVFVETAVVKPEALRETAKLVGQLEAEESVVLRPEIDGIVEDILFDEGARVEEGTVLVRLRDSQQEAELAAMRARAALAADTHRRFRELAEQEVTSAWELERVTRELEVAKAEVAQAEVALERTKIRAPFDGRLGARSISPGDRVSPDTDLVAIHATDRLRLIMPIPERYASLAEVGATVRVSVASIPDEWFTGEIYFVDPAVDVESRGLLLKGWVPNDHGRLRPGQFVEIRSDTREVADALAVPDSALVYESGNAFVWRVGAERKAERVDVETGIRDGGRIQVSEGLAAGDEVVVAGVNKVFPGATLKAAPPPSASAADPGRGES